MSPNLPPCLYCGDVDRLRTSEHVLQRGFGGNLTLPNDVCGDCNTRVFSPLDGELIAFAKSFGFHDPDDPSASSSILRQALALSFDPKTGAWLSLRMETTGKPVYLDQIVFLGDRAHVILDVSRNSEHVSRLQEILSELAVPSALSLSTLLTDNRIPPVQTALIRSAPKKYAVRAADMPSAERLKADLVSGKLAASLVRVATPAHKRDEIPGEVEHPLRFQFGNMGRALAKSALNFVCAALGPEVARGKAFDEIREYALTARNVGYAAFVGWILGAKDNLAEGLDLQYFNMFSKPKCHTMLLASVDEQPTVILYLYERPFAAVRMTSMPIHGAIPENTLVIGLFDYRAKVHRLYDINSDPEALQREFFPDGIPP